MADDLPQASSPFNGEYIYEDVDEEAGFEDAAAPAAMPAPAMQHWPPPPPPLPSAPADDTMPAGIVAGSSPLSVEQLHHDDEAISPANLGAVAPVAAADEEVRRGDDVPAFAVPPYSNSHPAQATTFRQAQSQDVVITFDDKEEPGYAKEDVEMGKWGNDGAKRWEDGVLTTPAAVAVKPWPIVASAATTTTLTSAAPAPARSGSFARVKRVLSSGGLDDDIVHPYGCYGTLLLLLAYLVLFLVEFGTDGWGMESWYVNPSGGPSYAHLDSLGGNIGYKLLGLRNLHTGNAFGQEWRIVTSVLWYSGVVTFIPGMAVLLWLGVRLEREYGFLRLGLLYSLSALFGVVFSSIFSVDLLVVSGSSGVFGLVGARAVDIWLYRAWYPRRTTLFRVVRLALVAGVGLVLGLLPLVDNWAHIGAMVMGALLAGVLFTGGWRSAPQRGGSGHGRTMSDSASATFASADEQAAATGEARTRRYLKTRWTCLALVVIVWVVALAVLFGAVAHMDTTPQRGTKLPVTEPWCTACDKFQCVETGSWTCRPSSYYN